jgi:hypothetical protein
MLGAMSLWKWVVLIAFVAVAAVLAARKFRSFQSQLLAQFPPSDERQPGNTRGARRHLNPHEDGAADAPPEPDQKDETRRS